MHAAARGVTLYRTLNFTDNATAYDVGGIPAQNLASKKEVKTIRVADLLGQRPAGWNASTLSGSRFPDRPMMRTLSEYDAHKRADYNFRAEQLDCTATTRYIPRMSPIMRPPTMSVASPRKISHPRRRSRRFVWPICSASARRAGMRAPSPGPASRTGQ